MHGIIDGIKKKVMTMQTQIKNSINCTTKLIYIFCEKDTDV
jgi:hypothetical protein